MEENVFPLPAVAGVLVQHYVEARLHTDHDDDAISERNAELQRRFQGSVATPYYILVEPASEEEIAEFAGASLGADDFREFLENGVEAARAGTRVADVSK